jgi:serine phosphatase RsbU (regulator of sigma subunit)
MDSSQSELDLQATPTFEIYLQGVIHSWLETVTILGSILVPLFFLLDFVIIPEEYASLLPRFGLYRLAVTLFAVGQYWVVRRTKPSAYSYIHGYVFTLVVGGMISQMTTDLGGFDAGYYAGLMLVLVAVNMLLPWKTHHGAINGALAIAIYILLNLIEPRPFKTESLISNLYFLGSIVVIATSITYVKNKLIKQEFSLRAELVSSHAELAQSERVLKEARDALWSEMEVAKRIQTALLPHGEVFPGFDIAATMLPAKEVGGDYYDLIRTKRGSWITIGDVSGHGVEAGLIMMMAQTSIRSVISNTPNLTPAAVLVQVNTVMKENISMLGVDHYMTASAILLENDQMIVAGMHQDIMIYRAKMRRTERIATAGAWIGVCEDIQEYTTDNVVPLYQNDVILLFTDGITEAADRNGEMFGDDRLEQVLKQYGELPVDQIVRKIINSVQEFQATMDDDMTLVIARRVGTDRVSSASLPPS